MSSIERLNEFRRASARQNRWIVKDMLRHPDSDECKHVTKVMTESLSKGLGPILDILFRPTKQSSPAETKVVSPEDLEAKIGNAALLTPEHVELSKLFRVTPSTEAGQWNIMHTTYKSTLSGTVDDLAALLFSNNSMLREKEFLIRVTFPTPDRPLLHVRVGKLTFPNMLESSTHAGIDIPVPLDWYQIVMDCMGPTSPTLK